MPSSVAAARNPLLDAGRTVTNNSMPNDYRRQMLASRAPPGAFRGVPDRRLTSNRSNVNPFRVAASPAAIRLLRACPDRARR